LKVIDTCYRTRAPDDMATLSDHLRGKKTTWTAWMYIIENATLSKDWMNLKRFIVVEKLVVSGSKTTRSVSYRISDVDFLSALDLLTGIRGHWGIESQTHWVRDVILGEDRNLIRSSAGAVIMSLLNTIVINFLRIWIGPSVKYAQIFFG
jgi:predicted transposase YbfD/YdcC